MVWPRYSRPRVCGWLAPLMPHAPSPKRPVGCFWALHTTREAFRVWGPQKRHRTQLLLALRSSRRIWVFFRPVSKKYHIKSISQPFLSKALYDPSQKHPNIEKQHQKNQTQSRRVASRLFDSLPGETDSTRGRRHHPRSRLRLVVSCAKPMRRVPVFGAWPSALRFSFGPEYRDLTPPGIAACCVASVLLGVWEVRKKRKRGCRRLVAIRDRDGAAAASREWFRTQEIMMGERCMCVMRIMRDDGGGNDYYV